MNRSALLVFTVLVLTAAPVFADFCPPGYFGPGGVGPCIPCTAGFVSSVEGSEFCSACPVGTFMPTEGGIQCLVCPDGFIASVPGSSECQPCPEGYTSNASHSGCVEEAVPTLTMAWGQLKVRYR